MVPRPRGPRAYGPRYDVLPAAPISSAIAAWAALRGRGAGSVLRADLVSVPSKLSGTTCSSLCLAFRRIACVRSPAAWTTLLPRDPPVRLLLSLKRLGVKWPYILYLGTLDPRKNLPRLVESYARLVERGCAEHLVLGGQYGWSVSELLSKAGPASDPGPRAYARLCC